MNHKTSQSVKRLGMRICLVLALVMCFSLFIFGAGQDPQPTEGVKKADETQAKKEEPKKEEDSKDSKCTGDLEVTFDYQTGKLVLTPNNGYVVSVGRNVTFRVDNINRLAYNVIINGKMMSYNNTPPTQFSTLGAPSTDTKTIVIGSKSETDSGDTRLRKTQDDIGRGDLESTFSLLDDSIKSLEGIKNLRANLKSILSESETFDKLKESRDDVFKKFCGQTPCPHVVEVLLECNKRLNTAKTNFDGIKNVLNDKLNPDNVERFLTNVKDKNRSGNMFELFQKMTQLEALLKEFADNKYIEEIDFTLANFKEENFSVSLTMPSVDADEVKFTLEIKPVDEKKTKVHHQLGDPVMVRVKGGWKIDFSTGVFFPINHLELNYWFDEVSEDKTSGILRLDKKWSTTPVVGGMMHVYPRKSPKKINWSGFAFGLSGGEADRLSYYLGSGVMIGKKNRFLINLGGVLAKFDSLLSKYSDKVDKEVTLPAEGESIVKSIYKLRFFLSLTYNL